MTSTELDELIETLWTNYKAEIATLYVTPESSVELTRSILDASGVDVESLEGIEWTVPPLNVGAMVKGYRNKNNGDVISVERSEFPIDYVDARLYVYE